MSVREAGGAGEQAAADRQTGGRAREAGGAGGQAGADRRAAGRTRGS